MAAQFQTKGVRTAIVSHSWVDERRVTEAQGRKILHPDLEAFHGL
jgi:hypothetical protein